MEKDCLFTLKPDFKKDGAGRFYCPDSLRIEGLLAYYPELKAKLDVVHVDYPRPRKAIVDQIGEANQGAPVLVLSGANAARGGTAAKRAGGKTFIDDPAAILSYVADTYGVGRSA
jgi:hypothetical protein